MVASGEEERFEMPAGMDAHFEDVKDFQDVLNESRAEDLSEFQDKIYSEYVGKHFFGVDRSIPTLEE